MIIMKKDPLSIATSLVFNLNLLRESTEYNINEIKSLRNLENHWKTIKKYIKMFQIIKEYCPEIELNNSNLTIRKSKLYQRLDPVERFILYLFNNEAIDPESAVNCPKEFKIEEINESKGYLYKQTGKNKFFLTKSGKNIFRLIKQNLSEIIFQQKSFNDLFPYQGENINNERENSIYISHNNEESSSEKINYSNRYLLDPTISHDTYSGKLNILPEDIQSNLSSSEDTNIIMEG